MTGPDCPNCGRLMVYHSNLHRYQCHKCIEDDREAEEPMIPWWWFFVVMAVLAVVLALIIAVLLPFPMGDGMNTTMGHVTEPTEEDVQVLDDRPLIIFLFVLIAGFVVLHLAEIGKSRCPSCGEVLRYVKEVEKYKCLHCGTWYTREDIDVEVVD